MDWQYIGIHLSYERNYLTSDFYRHNISHISTKITLKNNKFDLWQKINPTTVYPSYCNGIQQTFKENYWKLQQHLKYLKKFQLKRRIMLDHSERPLTAGYNLHWHWRLWVVKTGRLTGKWETTFKQYYPVDKYSKLTASSLPEQFKWPDWMGLWHFLVCLLKSWNLFQMLYGTY